MRFKILQEEGGIYLDTDAFPFRNMDELRRHEFTISYDNVVNSDKRAVDRFRFNNGVMLSAPKARFLRVWEKTYFNFDPSQFGHHSSVVPFHLATQYPDLVHVEWNRLAPISFGLQTSEAAAVVTCGFLLPKYHMIWYPRPSTDGNNNNEWVEDTHVHDSIQHKLVLHLTMSGVRGIAMLRQNLGQDDLQSMPSLLGHIFRQVYGNDTYDYQSLYELYDSRHTEKTRKKALDLWRGCREMLGMHTPLESKSKRKQSRGPDTRQQYMHDYLP